MSKAPAEHPQPEVLQRFMRSELGPAERRQIVRHLLTGCGQCRRVTARLWSQAAAGPLPPRRPERPESQEKALAVAEGPDPAHRVAWMEAQLQRMERDRERAPELMAALLERPAPARLALVYEEPRFRSPALCVLLVGRCREAAERLAGSWQIPAGSPSLACLPGGLDAGGLLELGELAVAVADRLDPREWGASAARGLAARAWSQLGNARRLARDLEGAGRALMRAELLFDRAFEEAVDRAELLCFRADLRRAQGRLGQADRLLRRAFDLVRPGGRQPAVLAAPAPSAGEGDGLGLAVATAEVGPEIGPTEQAGFSGERREMMGRILLRLATVRRHTGAPGESLGLQRRAVAFLSRSGGTAASRPLGEALRDLAEMLLEAGKLEEAHARLEQAREVCERLAEPVARLLLTRLASRLELARGRPQDAELLLVAAENDLVGRGHVRASLPVLADRAALYAGQGRRGDLPGLAKELHPAFCAPAPLPVAAVTAAGLILLQRAFEPFGEDPPLGQPPDEGAWQAPPPPGVFPEIAMLLASA